MDQPNKEKKTRRKRRVPGSLTPPRVPVLLRLEVGTYQKIKELLSNYKISCNKYIEGLIEFDLNYRSRIQNLNLHHPSSPRLDTPTNTPDSNSNPDSEN